MIEGEELLEVCDKIWNRVNNLMKKGFDSESVYNDKYLKIKTKSYDGNEIPTCMIMEFLKKVLIVFVCLW